MSQTRQSTSYKPPVTTQLGGWSEKEFIKQMFNNGWQKINDNGNKSKNPRKATGLWIHNKTEARFEAGKVDFLDDIQCVLWRSFAAIKQTPSPF